MKSLVQSIILLFSLSLSKTSPFGMILNYAVNENSRSPFQIGNVLKDAQEHNIIPKFQSSSTEKLNSPYKFSLFDSLKYGKWFSLRENGELVIAERGQIDREDPELCPAADQECLVSLQIFVDINLDDCQSSECSKLSSTRKEYPKSINVQIHIIDEVLF